jgi:RNA polymerase-interacting CarD/CdnL/TRCF family regulator
MPYHEKFSCSINASTRKKEEGETINEKDLNKIADKTEALVRWFAERDMTVEEALFVLSSTLVSFAKQFDVPKAQVDRMYEDMWKAVKTYQKA